MSVDPLLFFDLIATVFILGMTLAVVAVLHTRTMRKVQKLMSEQAKTEANLHKKAGELLENAQGKASAILEKAQTKALELINSAQFYNEETKHVFEDQLKAARQNQSLEFDETSKEFLESYKKAIEELKSGDIKDLHNISKSIEQDAEKQVGDFAKIIEEETVSAQKIVERKIEEEYRKVREEVDHYKATQLAKIDEQIYEIIKKVTAQALGKGLSLEEHEQLVVDALEKAKSELIQ